MSFLKSKSYISIDQIDSLDQVKEIFAEADAMKEIVLVKEPSEILHGHVIAELFYQPSTRTFTSFLAAAKWLGAESIPIHGMSAYSSAVKGETIEDTVKSIHQTTAADLIVLRHPENDSSDRAAEASYVPIVNAGSGKKEHPTQALLDLYTIMEHHETLEDLTITFVGDMKFGRTVKSLAKLIAKITDSVSFNFVSPDSLKLPEKVKEALKANGAEIIESNSLESVISMSDVLYVTRVQKEWFKDNIEEYEAIKDSYIVNNEMLEKADEDLVIMHPLPRVNEIHTEVDDDPRAKYFEQMRNGLYVRMALLKLILGK